ncbi:MAG: tetratricopeptide repeat protein [Blastocatellia bacterium]|nr:tetratricopeptide repeat protein [Blastocatellia bacterium]
MPSSTDSAKHSHWSTLVLTSLQVGSRWWLVGILLCCFGVYAQTFRFDFVFDDHIQIEKHERIRSWDHWGKAFTEHIWAGIEEYPTSNYYRPVFRIWQTLNYSLFGLNPRGWHVLMVVVYLLSIVSFWKLAEKLLQDGVATVIAATVFAFHPTHVEAVAWLGCINDPLVVIFFSLSFLAYLKATSDTTTSGWTDFKYLALSVISLGLALLTKEFAVLLAPMMFLYEVLVRRQTCFNRGALLQIWSILRLFTFHWVVLGLYLLVHKLVIPQALIANPKLTLTTVLLTAPLIYLNYLKLLLWPLQLRAEYELGYVTSVSNPGFFLPLMGLLSLALFCGWRWRKNRLVLLLFLWLIGPLMPALFLWGFRENEFIHDRYLFLPSVAFACLIGLAGTWVSHLFLSKPNLQAPFSATAEPTDRAAFSVGRRAPGVSLFLLGCLGCWFLPLTLKALPVWANDVELYSEVLKYHPNNLFALQNLSVALRSLGRFAEEQTLMERLVSLEPGKLEYRYGLAGVYQRTGRYPQMLEQLRFLQNHEANFLNNGENCFMVGYALFMTKNPVEAIPYLNQATSLASSNPQYWYTLGETHVALHQTEEALRAYRKVLELVPQQEVVRRKINALESKPEITK